MESSLLARGFWFNLSLLALISTKTGSALPLPLAAELKGVGFVVVDGADDDGAVLVFSFAGVDCAAVVMSNLTFLTEPGSAGVDAV